MDSWSSSRRFLRDVMTLEIFRKLQRFTPRERRLLCQAAGLHLFAHLLLCLCSLKTLTAWLQRRTARAAQRRGGAGCSASDIERLAALVAIADAHHALPPSCLRCSLVLSWLLSARGIESVVTIGVAKDHGALRAHAWVETRTPGPRRFFEDTAFAALLPPRPATVMSELR